MNVLIIIGLCILVVWPLSFFGLGFIMWFCDRYWRNNKVPFKDALLYELFTDEDNDTNLSNGMVSLIFAPVFFVLSLVILIFSCCFFWVKPLYIKLKENENE